MKLVVALSFVLFAGCQKENPDFCCTSAETCSSLGVTGMRDCAGGFTCVDDIHTCVTDGCGNGVLEGSEVCDDGNNTNDDGCSGNCLKASCFVPVTHPSVQAAIDDTSCSTIHVASGAYAENVMIGRDVAISGAGPAPIILDGQAAGSVVTILSGTVTLENLTIRNGLAERGGGVFSRGMTTLRGAHVESNTAVGLVGAGGGIYNDGGSLILDQSTVSMNHANTNGVSGDPAGAAGAGIFSASGEVQITGGSVDSNNIQIAGIAGGSAKGAGIAIDTGDLSISAATLSSNVIDLDGHPDTTIAVTSEGAAVFVGTGTLTISSSAIMDNKITAKGGYAEATGGGIFAPQAEITDTIIQTNSIQVFGDNDGEAVGAGIYLAGAGESTITSTTISANTLELTDADVGGPGLRGAAIALDGSGSLSIQDSNITGNQGTVIGDEIVGEGGGLSWRPNSASTVGTLSVTKSTISGNVMRSSISDGAGLGSEIAFGTTRSSSPRAQSQGIS